MPALVTGTIDKRFVLPRVARGDYYLIRSSISGRKMYVYPRKIGERYFPVVQSKGLGVENTTNSAPNLLSWIMQQPAAISQQVTEAREELAVAKKVMTVTIAASLIASTVAVVALVKGMKKE